MSLYDYRYVSVECEIDESTAKEQKVNEMYLCIMKRFSQALVKVRESSHSQRRQKGIQMDLQVALLQQHLLVVYCTK